MSAHHLTHLRERARLGLLLSLLSGCAAGPTAGMRVAFEEADVARAQRAPDLLARAERAREASRASESKGNDAAAADYATEARLWLRAALVEADRLELTAVRIVDESDEERAAVALAETRSARRALEADLGRERAAEVAREQMEVAFTAARAREDPIAARRGAATDVDRRAAARAFVDRARLLTAAAMALGATNEQSASLSEALQNHREPRDARQSLLAAIGLHRRALSLLGEARARSPVTVQTIKSLVEAARERELDIVIDAEGAFIAMPARRADAVAELLRQFPHGPVRVRGTGARRVASQLGRAGVRANRIEAQDGRASSGVQLPAYGRANGLPAGDSSRAEEADRAGSESDADGSGDRQNDAARERPGRDGAAQK